MTDKWLDHLALESLVYGDSAHVAHLVLEGLTDEADAYARQPEVQARIRRWKASRP